jgi:hypothetical protein
VRAPLRLSAAAGSAAAVLIGAAIATAQPGLEDEAHTAPVNPCLGEKRHVLLCPNLQMSPPGDLWLERTGGRRLLHARNSINSRGLGPAELRGHRTGRFTMHAVQAIHDRGGGVRLYDTHARLGWKAIPGQDHYWKFRDAGVFEVWSLDRHGRPKRRVRTGEKQYYCLRDLFRTAPSGRSPSQPVYPGCNQNAGQRRVTLGTSVGWSDVYPSTYYEQYIDVTGLRGRFGFFQVADPENRLWETDETDNAGETVVKLPSARVVRTHSRVDRPRPGHL